MIRAAAKNYQDVAVVVSPADYAAHPRGTALPAAARSRVDTHWRLARKAFRTTADYDPAISARLERVDEPVALPPTSAAARAQADRPALRREPAPVGRAVRQGRAGHRRRRAVAGQGTLLQQPGGSGRRLATGAASSNARRRHHQAHQPVRLRRAGHARRAYRKALEARSGLGLRRRDRHQPPVDEETAREIAKTFIEAIAAPGLLARSAGRAGRQEEPARHARRRRTRIALVVKSISGGYPGADRRRPPASTAPRPW